MIPAIERPVIPYHGGKWQIANWIHSYFPPHRTYTETFGGAASVLMLKVPSAVEVYNDTSKEMVNLFRVLRDRRKAARLRQLLYLTPYSREEWIHCHELCEDDVEQARRTIVLSMMSINQGKTILRQSNGWKSDTKTHRHPQSFRRHTRSLEQVTERLQNVLIECRDAIKVLNQHDSDESLHYIDPPYLGKERKDQRSIYSEEKLSIKNHGELAEYLHSLQGFVLLSGYPSKEYQQWYGDRGWYGVSRPSKDGSRKKGQKTRTEVLWLNPKAADHQTQGILF